MEWKPVTQPPPLGEGECGWPESLPVLGYCTDGTIRVVVLEWIDEDGEPAWYTNCSEHWNMGKGVTHWMPLPEPPSNA